MIKHFRCAMYLLAAGTLWQVSIAQSRLYVVQYDEYLGQIVLSNGEIASHLLPLGAGCNDVVVAGTHLYVTNSFQNTVQEIDANTNTTLREIPMDGGLNPYSVVAVNSDTLAVTNWVSNDLSLVSLSQGRVVARPYVGDGPEGIAAFGEHVFVCLSRYDTLGSYGPGVVVVLDRQSFQLLDSIQVGTNPQFVAIDNLGRLHVACTGDYVSTPGRVDVVDPETLETIAILELGGTPASIGFADNFAFVSAGGWGDEGYVYRYRLSDLAILNDQTNPIATGAGATDIAGLSDGTFLVSCFMTDEVELRSSDGTLITRYPVSDGPGQIALYPSPQLEVSPWRKIPTATSLVEACPNPFNASTRIRLLSVSEESRNLIVYNALGQFVAILPVQGLSKEVTWDGTDGKGIPLPSGVFYVKSDAKEIVEMCTLVLLR